MFHRILPYWSLLLCISIVTVADAQDNTAMWNAAKRWKLGLGSAPPAAAMDTRSEATRNPVRGDNPDSPPNTPDIQVFNPSQYWQSENSIGVSFTNPNNLMVSTNGRIPGSNPVVHQPWAFSTDGGVTWPASLQSEDIPPGILDCFGDPVAFFDVGGKAYYCTLGSPGGIYFVTTTNFGATWSARANADNVNSTNDDKQHAAADFSGTFPNNVYAAWTDFGVTGTPVQFSRSTDRGVTWLPRVALPIGSNRGQGVHIAIGPNGEVYPMWAHYTTGTAEVGIGFAKSTDGGATFSTPTIAYPINGIRTSNGTITAINSRAASFPYHDVDRSNGSRRGWIYVVTPELVSGQADIFIRRSTDGGSTWSSAIQVNGPDVQAGKWQFMPSIAVDPATGGITISYYSQDSVGTNLMVNRYAAYSVDGGDTWDNWVISDVRTGWGPQLTPSTNTSYNGDYYETAAMGGKAWALWTDRRFDMAYPPADSNRAFIERIIYGENFGWVRGTVSNTVGGAPLQGVAIDFVENVLQQSGSSNASGLYFAGALVDTPGTTANLTLRARRFGFLDTTLAVTLTRNDTLTRNFGLRPLDLVLTKSSITFPPTPVPGSKQDSLVARNQFASPLTLSSLTTTNPDFAVSPTSVVIPALDSVKIYVTYTPTAEGTDTGRVIVMSSSIYTPRKDVILDGTAIGVPHFTASADSLTKTLEGGVRDSVTFYMRNVGTTSGNFSARAVMFPRTAPNQVGGNPYIMPVTVVPASPAPAFHPEDLAPAGSVQPSRSSGMPVSPSIRSVSPAANALSLQQVPELLYYKFDEVGQTSTANLASPGVGTNPAPVLGLTMGGAGQFGSALVGNGAASSTNYVNTGWNTALGSGSWTISMYLDNLPSNTTLYYLLGDNTANSFRSFIGGAAGAGNITLRATGLTDMIVTAVAPGPTVVTYVYDAPTQTLKSYKNGVLVGTRPATVLTLNGTSPFKVGGYSTSTGLPSGGLMDEFRMYNRALDDGEVAATWNTELGGGAWFSVQPREGTVAIGDSILMKAYFDATDSSIYNDPGNYLGRLDVVATNSSLADTLRIPARMFVVPPPNARLTVDRDSVNFGNVEIGVTDSSQFVTVRNIGQASLNVTNITMSNNEFGVSPTSFTLGSLDTVRLRLRFTANAPGGLRTGTMTFVSNDPSAPTVGLFARSTGVAHIATNPGSFTFTRGTGSDTTVATLRVRNTGTDTLRFLIDEQLGSSLASVQRSMEQQEVFDLGKDERSPSGGGPIIDGQGGPDAFGYRWIDSDEPGGPQYNWVEIKNVGTQITGLADDTNVGPFAIGFTFPFYGNNYDQIRFCTNGWLTFTSTSTAYDNTAIPTTAEPNNALYPFWDDLNFNEPGGTAWYMYDAANQRFIVEWDTVSHYLPGTTPGRYSFQVILRPNGDMLFQYRKMEGTTNSATIGIENVGGTIALQTVFNAAYMHDNLAILLTKDVVPWMSTNPVDGTIAPGDSQSVQVRIHPAGLAGGNYAAQFRVTGNTPDTVTIPVSLTLTVGVGDEAAAIPTEYALTQNYPNPFNPTTTINFDLPHESTVRLTIYNILGQEVIRLVDGVQEAGYLKAVWDGTNALGGNVGSGIYFFRFEATAVNGNHSFSSLKKMILLK